MPSDWYYVIDGERLGPVEKQELKELADDGLLQPTDLVWTEGMADWKPASEVRGLFSGPSPVRPHHQSHAGFDPEDREYRLFVNNKIIAGLCGILLGSLGIHKFILGLTTPGIIMLALSVMTCGLGTLITAPVGLIEGVIYLTRSDEEFYELYAIEKRGWF